MALLGTEAVFRPGAGGPRGESLGLTGKIRYILMNGEFSLPDREIRRGLTTAKESDRCGPFVAVTTHTTLNKPVS